MSKYEIHGMNVSSNTWKVVYVAEELGVKYKYTAMNPQTGDHKKPEHLARHPLGKLPTLTCDGHHIFESGAICRFLARNEGSEKYPKDPMKAAYVDQWMNFFTCHLGRNFNAYTFENFAKEKFGMGKPNKVIADAAMKDIEAQLPVVDAHFKNHNFITGETLTIADLYAFAYSENAEAGRIPLNDFPSFNKWYRNIKGLDAVKRAHKILGRV
jgi:glutathione S-transferase